MKIVVVKVKAREDREEESKDEILTELRKTNQHLAMIYYMPARDEFKHTRPRCNIREDRRVFQ